ncbi:MAG: SAM-dependent methyltransferase, partial [Lactobacillus sp.]|nr:SAM-dependent methyltransferase [Lactobacillus sp.]
MTNFLHKLTMLDDEINHSTVHSQVEEIKQIDHQVAKGEPLIEAPAKLGLLPDQFEDILEEIGNNQKRKLTDINNLFNNFRQYLSLKY